MHAHDLPDPTIETMAPSGLSLSNLVLLLDELAPARIRLPLTDSIPGVVPGAVLLCHLTGEGRCTMCLEEGGRTQLLVRGAELSEMPLRLLDCLVHLGERRAERIGAARPR